MVTRKPLDSRGRWLAITAATVVMQFSYWPMVFAVAASTDDEVVGAGALVLGLALMPAVFLVAAFASRHDRAPGAVLKAMGLFILIALPIGLLDIVVGASVGFAAGGAVSLRREEAVPSRRWRWYAVGGVGLWILLLLFVVPSFAVMSGAILPFAVHGIVDQAIEDRERDLAGT